MALDKNSHSFKMAPPAKTHNKNDLSEFSALGRGRRGSAQWAQSGAGAAAPNPTLLAPGARMRVV